MNECPCTYPSCTRNGKCCECVKYHSSAGEFPACFFSKDAEKSYDRSYRKLREDKE